MFFRYTLILTIPNNVTLINYNGTYQEKLNEFLLLNKVHNCYNKIISDYISLHKAIRQSNVLNYHHLMVKN